MKILIIEPHGDDALLSCNSLLETNNEIDILTLGESRASDGLKEYYSSIQHTEYLGLEEIPPEKSLLNTHQIHRDFKEHKPIAKNYNKTLSEYFGERYLRVKEKALNVIKKKDLSEYDLLVCCSGISHPYHVAVRNAMRDYLVKYDRPILWYGDKPYLSTRYSKEFYITLPELLDTDSEINEGYEEIEENKKVREVISKVYPSEVKLFRFYSDIILNCRCKYLYNSRYSEIVNIITNDL